MGGAGLLAGIIANGFVADHHQVFVITSVQDKKLQGLFEENGLRIYRIYSDYNERWRSYRSLYNWSTVGRVRSILRDIRPDIVHAHNIHYHISYHCLKIAREFTDKVFVTLHDIMSFYPGTFTEFIDRSDLSCPTKFNYRISWIVLVKAFKKRFNPFRNGAVKYYLSKAKKLVAVSHALKDALQQNGINNCEVIHNGISNVRNSVVDMRELESRYNLENKRVILFGGRLSGPKGGDIMLQAMVIISKHVSNARLVVFGRQGNYSDKMLKRTRELGIHEQIIFAGWHGEDVLKDYFDLAKVVVVPSVCFDSFPTVNLQASIRRKPVVATCFGGSREIIENGVNGFIVNPFDIENLSDKIIQLLANPKMASEFGEKGYQIVSSKFNLKVMIDSYESLFNL
jgi:glycosyltransferase involved in cell wall biosynthesis